MKYTQLAERDIATLRPYAGNARTHSRKQVKQIAASIERFGFTNPVLVSDDGTVAQPASAQRTGTKICSATQDGKLGKRGNPHSGRI